VRTITGGSDPENFDISKDGTQLYVSNEDAALVSVVDLASGAVVRSAKVGGEPEVKTTPDGKLVYVTSEDTGTISVLDPAAGKILKTFKVGRRPRSVAFMPDGSKAYVNAENDGSVVVVDALKQEMIATIPLGKPGVVKPMDVLLSPDASKLYVSTGRGHQAFARRQDPLHGQRPLERYFRRGHGDEHRRPEDPGGHQPLGHSCAGALNHPPGRLTAGGDRAATGRPRYEEPFE
jgi:YVTN family beta-propeller protein